MQASFVHAVTIIIDSHYTRGFLEDVLNFKKTSKLFVIALLAFFSSETCERLWKQGFRNVKNVEGGYAAWVENGIAVKKPQAQDEL